MNQNYESELMPTEYVIRGNSAILKCSVPSFVADFITVEAWLTNEGQTYTKDSVESKRILPLRNKKRNLCLIFRLCDTPYNLVQSSSDFFIIMCI